MNSLVLIITVKHFIVKKFVLLKNNKEGSVK